ncbi:TPA: hypothetical protein QEL18_001014 [Stenotrophomonas maltophilia]|nr:hypothetical protein [Stenotrophomonas maltophilia]
MNQARAKKHLLQLGICLSRQDGPSAERWLTTASNSPENRRCFATIRAAVEHWDEQARWLAFDTALAQVTLAQEKAQGSPHLIANNDTVKRNMSTASSAIRASFPKNWKDIVKAWVGREGSIAGIDISKVLTHARTEEKALRPPPKVDANYVYRVAKQRDFHEG